MSRDKAVRLPSLLLETLAVAVAGAVFGVAANAISPRGIALSAPVTAMTPASASQAPNPKAVPPAGTVAGYRVLSRDEVVSLQADPRSLSGQFVFIDARGEHHYREARLPGALSLDPYNPGAHLEAVVKALAGAECVIVYCNGQQCADSRLAAELIVSLGVPADRIAIYLGGFKDWIEARQPLERGELIPIKP